MTAKKNICTKGQVICEYANETGECKHKICVSPTMNFVIATKEGIREAERILKEEQNDKF